VSVVKETIGMRLRRLRVAHELSAAALARKVDVTEAAIRAIESGDSKSPSFIVGVRLAEALGVTARYLAFGDGPDLETRVLAIERRLGPPRT
jgi:transcriptional regulator with XRE-family HTH domain